MPDERLEAGSTAPDFTLLDENGARVSLHDFLGSRVIVYFYPAAGTPGCTTQACDFATTSTR
jgi:peroxiredoxin Q/BCP